VVEQTVAVPSTVHCRPFDTGKVGAKKDLQLAIETIVKFMISLVQFLINMDRFLESRRWYHSPGCVGEITHFPVV
jgi:hypothetical protein